MRRADRASAAQRRARRTSKAGTRHGWASIATRPAVSRPSGALHSATSSPLSRSPSPSVAILGCVEVS